MRVHHLRAVAFGPFTDAVEVDGDALTADGLFLLAGDTGAGKSSILDAICFALYGAVPGRRNEAKALRSDLAPPDVAPEVVLEVGLGGRRYRFTRSPAWERPKKRGTGTTTQQAAVSVQRLDGDGWTHLTNRLDEAGDLVGRLLGMTCPQFCQVAMLPQGEFQQFLHARSDDRQQVLQQLFRTDRYDRIERWLAEHRRRTRRDADARRQAATDVAHRLAEAGGTTVPAHLVDDAVDPRGPDGLTAWAAGLHEAAGLDAAEARAAAARTGAALEVARADLATQRRVAERRDTHARATARRAALLAEEDHLAEARDRLDAARRAAAVAGLADHARDAETGLDRAERARATAVREAGLDGDGDLFGAVGPDRADLADVALADVRRRLDRLRDARPLEGELRAAQQRVDRLGADLAADRGRLDALAGELGSLPAEVEDLRARRDASSARAATVPALTETLRRAEEGLAAARRTAGLGDELTAARAAEQAARDDKVTCHEHWLAVREARLEGIAAELAGGLAVGQDCPVCGSCEHPSPARAGHGAADVAAERRARQELDTAEAGLEVHRDRVRGLQTTLAVARAAAQERTAEQWDAERDAATGGLEAARRAVDEAADLAHRLAGATTRLETAREERDRLGRRVAAAETAGAAAADAVAGLARRLAALVGDEPDVAAALRSAQDAEARLDAAVRARDDHERAVERAATARAGAEASARAHRFADLAAARAARLDQRAVDRLEAEDRRHREAVTEVGVALADPAVAAAAAGPAPDVAAAEQRLADAEREAAAASHRLALTSTRATRLTALLAELAAALEALAPAAAEAERAAAVADLASGRGADNRAGLALPAYVLSWRLGQVVGAANVRLARMTDGRYVLEHRPDAPTRGGRRGGLDLLVRDEWSGRSRSPATLSGGETFVVSLALALGLADVVTSEAAADATGADIETLFVDEGFGSLDADTLDDVLAVLDELREGGRAVGVVSHVAGMRERIGTRLEVLKGDRGSRVRLVHA